MIGLRSREHAKSSTAAAVCHPALLCLICVYLQLCCTVSVTLTASHLKHPRLSVPLLETFSQHYGNLLNPNADTPLLGANQQPALDTVGMGEMCLHSRGNCGWISLLACLSLLLLGGGIFEHLYFRSTDLQNSNAIVQNDFLAIEQKSLITPSQPTSPTYWKINIRQWAGQLPKIWRKILLDIPLSTTLPIPWAGTIIDRTRWVKKQGK